MKAILHTKNHVGQQVSNEIPSAISAVRDELHALITDRLLAAQSELAIHAGNLSRHGLQEVQQRLAEVNGQVDLKCSPLATEVQIDLAAVQTIIAANPGAPTAQTPPRWLIF